MKDSDVNLIQGMLAIILSKLENNYWISILFGVVATALIILSLIQQWNDE